MALNISEGSGGFTPETGIHNARCIGIIDIGTQDEEYQGHKKTPRKGIFLFELYDLTVEGENGPHSPRFSQFYTLSLAPKANLRKALVGWRGKQFTSDELKEFDVFNVVGHPCVLTIGLSETGKVRIESISRHPDPKAAPEASLPIQNFSFEEFEGAFPDWMSDGIKGLCKASHEYRDFILPTDEQAAPEESGEPEPFDDEIPF